MSSDRLGKFREKSSRQRTPYSRPKGIMRRVTDSVSGIINRSWIPGFLRSSDQDEDHRPQSGHSIANLYPEEAGVDSTLNGNSNTLEYNYVRNFSSNNSTMPSNVFSEITDNYSLPSTSSQGGEASSSNRLSADNRTIQQPTPIEQIVVDSRSTAEQLSFRTLNNQQHINNNTIDRGTAETPPILNCSSSKRPRFSLAAYSTAATPPGDKSVLSDGSFRSSPFYPGRTIYGGAAAYRRTPTPVTPTRSNTCSPAAGDGGLSATAQRILSSLNSLSTPLTAAKRIPTSSYTSSPYTAAFSRHRPVKAPPLNNVNTPRKVGVESKLSQYMLPSESSYNAQQPSIFSVAAANATLKQTSLPASTHKQNETSTLTETVAQKQNESSTLIEPAIQKRIKSSILMETTTPTSNKADAASTTLYSREGGGKMKAAVKSSGRVRGGNCEILIEEQQDDECVALTRVPTLPKINFTAPITLTTNKKTTGGSEFVFSTPKVLDEDISPPSSTSNDIHNFDFRVPSPVEHNNNPSTTNSSDNSNQTFNFIKPSSVSALPKVKPSLQTSPEAKKSSLTSSIVPAAKELNHKSGALLDFLSKNSSSSTTNIADSISNNSTANSDSTPTIPTTNGTLKSNSNWGTLVKSGPPKWECDTCLLHNTLDADKCIACETPNPKAKPAGTNNSTTQCTTSGFGSNFKKNAGDWECDTCLLRNKTDSVKCVACETPKPGATSKDTASSSSQSFSFGVNNDNTDTSTAPKFNFGVSTSKESGPTTFSFGINASSSSTKTSDTSSSSTGTNATASTFTFGLKPASKAELPNTEAKTTTSTATVTKTTTSNTGFGDMFKKVAGDWDCDTCLVRNKANVSDCVSCGTPNASKQATKSVDNPGSFGDKSSKKAEGDWKCKVCLMDNKGNLQKMCQSCEAPKPTTVASDKIVTGNFKFGTNCNDTANNNSSMKFGIDSQKTDSIFGGSNSSKPVEKSLFSFGSNTINPAEKVSSAFTFGGGNPVNSIGKASVPAFGIGTNNNSKVTTTGFNSCTPPNGGFTFGSKPADTTVPSNANELTKITTSSEPKTVVDLFNSKDSSCLPPPSYNAAVSSNGLVKTSNTSSFNNTSMFTFGSSKTNRQNDTVSVESNGIASTKKSSEDVSHNNGIVDNASVDKFVFGSKSPVVPLFEFGTTNNNNNNNDSFLKTTATAPPSFGTTNNNSGNAVSPVFAFGEPPQKKTQTTPASFDFGQASPAPSYNFAASTPASTNFQFGQASNPASAAASGPVYQFGSPAPPSFGGTAASEGGNPFSQAGNTTGRVFKRAHRKLKK